MPSGKKNALLNVQSCSFLLIWQHFFNLFIHLGNQTFIFLKMFDLFHFISFRDIPSYKKFSVTLFNLADDSMSVRNKPPIDNHLQV